MESEDIIKLDLPCHFDGHVEVNDYEKSLEKETSSSISKENASDVNHTKADGFADVSIVELRNENTEDSQHVQDMELENASVVPKLSVHQENVTLFDSFESVDKFETEFATNIISTNSVSIASVNNMPCVDKSPITSAKRARTASYDQQPSVRVVYNCLTRESKKILMELMQQWSQWQAKHQSSTNVSEKVALESGEDTYFAALHIGSERTNAVPFWFDSQNRNEDIGDSVKLDGDMVPIYDRGFTLGLTALDGTNNIERNSLTSEASRCFNCGSYSHALKECSKPRDNVAINNARKQRSSKRNQNPTSRSQIRYYQKAPGKFDDLKAGVLGTETRDCLGIGELDPPPWLNRMRELGYPPGYLDDVEEDQPSGITIFVDEDDRAESEEGELPERLEPAPPKKRTTVEFPGINAPIPEKADNWLWAAPSSPYVHSSHSNPNRPPDLHRSRYHDQPEFKDRHDNGPPGSAHGFAAFSRPGYPARYCPQDHNNSTMRTPSLARSLSDRSRQSQMPYENLPLYSPRSPHSPHPISGLAWQSPRYHTPASSHDHRSQERDPNRHDNYWSSHRR